MTTPTNLAAADLLDRAAGRVERGWTQHVYAKDQHGLAVDPRFKGAVLWCAVGALACDRASGHVAEYAELSLMRLVSEPVSIWNDAPGRTQAEVAGLMRETAKRLRGDA